MIIKLQYSLIVLSFKRGFFLGGGTLPNSRRLTELFCILDQLPGCFVDDHNRVLESGPHSLQVNGKSQCVNHCATLGSYRYFGLQVTIQKNFFISYGFFLYLYCFTCLLVTVLFKNIYWSCHFSRNQSFFEIDFFYKFHMNNFLTALR